MFYADTFQVFQFFFYIVTPTFYLGGYEYRVEEGQEVINIRNVREGVARRPMNCQSVACGLSLCSRSPPLSFRHFYIKNRKSISHVRFIECTIKLLLLWYFEHAVFIHESLLSIHGMSFFFFTWVFSIEFCVPNKRVALLE